jgi:uncharacterized protein YndB with AHSA1/START domain
MIAAGAAQPTAEPDRGRHPGFPSFDAVAGGPGSLALPLGAIGHYRACIIALHHPQKGNEIMSTNTIRLHRVLRATPERIYRAFLDADAMAKWLPPNGFTGKVHHMDARVGGTHKMSFTNFTTGHSHSFGGKYLELMPHERIRYTDKFDDPNLPGELQVTVTLKKVSVGTELNIVQEGVPDVIPPEACYLGWQESLTLLAKLVEAEIPD